MPPAVFKGSQKKAWRMSVCHPLADPHAAGDHIQLSADAPTPRFEFIYSEHYIRARHEILSVSCARAGMGTIIRSRTITLHLLRRIGAYTAPGRHAAWDVSLRSVHGVTAAGR